MIAYRMRALLVALVAVVCHGAKPINPLLPFPTPAPASITAPYLLLADRLPSPALGIDSLAPLLSWAVPASVPTQASARVVVSLDQGSAPTVAWDSGWMSTSSQQVRYTGQALAPATRYSWTVQVSASPTGPTGTAGTGTGTSATSATTATTATTSDISAISEVSEPAVFITGLHGALQPQVVPLWAANGSAAFVLLRAEVPLSAPLSQLLAATVYITAAPQVSIASAEVDNSKLLGAYKLWVNGGLAGMGPGKPSRCGPLCPVQHAAGNCTCSPEQLLDVRDVTSLLTSNGSATTLTLAVAAFNYAPSSISLQPTASRVLLQAHLAYQGGVTQVVGTETSSGAWAAYDATGYMNPQGNMGMGAWHVSPRENFDARQAPVGWRLPGYDPSGSGSGWQPAAAVEPFAAPLVSRPTRALALTDDPAVVAPPVEVLWYGNGSRMFVDFGVDFTGGVCLDVQSGVAGTRLLMAFAEEVDYTGAGANLTLAAAPMRTGNNYTSVWTLRDGPQTICSHEYAQFRYAQFTALPGGQLNLAAQGAAARAWLVTYPAEYYPSSSLSFVSDGTPAGDATVAALEGVWRLSWYTRAAQGLDAYLDHVRQRDVYCVEELTIDLLQQYALSTEWTLQPLTLSYVLNNRPVSLGWAEWPALAVWSVHEIYTHTGDLELFTANYQQLRNWTLLELVNASTGLWTCSVPPVLDCQQPEVDWPPSSRDGFVFTPTNTVVNVIAYRAMVYFSEMAAAAGGHDADAAFFASAAAALRTAINEQLWDAAAGGYVDGLTTAHRAWHSSAFALGTGVPTPDMLPAVRAAVLSRMAGWNTSAPTCFPSNVWPTQWAVEGLYTYTPEDHGVAALAALTCAAPQGWVAMLALNFTQAPEAWSDGVKGNEELGMTWGAAPADLIPRFMLGVMPAAPGFAAVLVRPQPGSLAGVSGTVPTIRGPITVQYQQTFVPTSSNNSNSSTQPQQVVVATASLSIALPGNVPTTACLPLSACGGGSVLLVDGVVTAGTAQSDYLCVNVTAAGAAPRRLQCPVTAARFVV